MSLGHANVLLMIKIGIYRLLISCEAGVDASRPRNNARQDSYRQHVNNARGKAVPELLAPAVWLKRFHVLPPDAGLDLNCAACEPQR